MPNGSTRLLRLKIRGFWPLVLIEQALAAIVFDRFVASLPVNSETTDPVTRSAHSLRKSEAVAHSRSLAYSHSGNV